jgi:lipoyl(octanoyl) transferase
VELIRLLPFAAVDGPINMAADEAMLESAANGVASLRFYTWNPPTLSLGYFQSEAVRSSDPLLASLPFVRRASGGATLVHHHELTYALALPAGAPWQRRGESWICRIHQTIAAALRSCGVSPDACPNGAEKKLGEVLCFLHQTPGDLILKGHKIAGSAQRKQRGNLLQHGAILLSQSRHTPSLPGIRELAGIELQTPFLADAIIRQLKREANWIIEQGDWTPGECARTRELAETKYRTNEWNFKR